RGAPFPSHRRMVRASPSAKSRYASDSEHGLEDRPHPAARQHGYGRGRAAGATERPGRPRTLPLHAIAARPLHGAKPTGEAAVALGLRRAPLLARQGALAAKPELLRGRLARSVGKSRPLTPPAAAAARPAPPPRRQAPSAPHRAAAR